MGLNTCNGQGLRTSPRGLGYNNNSPRPDLVIMMSWKWGIWEPVDRRGPRLVPAASNTRSEQRKKQCHGERLCNTQFTPCCTRCRYPLATPMAALVWDLMKLVWLRDASPHVAPSLQFAPTPTTHSHKHSKHLHSNRRHDACYMSVLRGLPSSLA
jgi:hypothetical protein